MKTIIATSLMTALLITSAVAQNQGEDYLGLPGDNLNLYAVMRLFQESQTLEEFERNLNDESSRINNLDLNSDNQIDYISVFDNINGNVHNIVLQVAINQRERQDVAVFTVGRDSDGNVWLQLTGDEALYGKNYIIEPILTNVAETPNPGYVGNATTVNGRNVVSTTTTVANANATTVVTVTTWPIITYVYSPAYVVWRSPWYWGYYPPYWNPWRPQYWHYYYGYHYHWNDRYYVNYHRINYHRYDYWNRYYYRPHYTSSRVVTRNIRSGGYKVTYSRPDERARGEALYISTHGNNNRRQENVGTTNNDRRTPTTTTNNRSNVNSSSSSNRRDATTTRQASSPASTSANRRTDASTQRSTTQSNTTERKATPSSSNTRSSSSSVNSSSRRTSQQPSTQAKSSSRSETRAATRTSTESNSSRSKSESNETNSNSSTTRESRRR